MASPVVRPAAGLEVFVVEDGYVIHDDSAGRVHHLNLTAALVWELADGRTDAAGIAAGVAESFGLSTAPVAEVEACIAQLLESGVLADAADEADGSSDVAGAGDEGRQPSRHQSSDVS